MNELEIQTESRAWLGLSLITAGVVSAIVLSSTVYLDYPLVLDEHGSYWLLQSDVPSSLMERSLDCAAIPPLSAWVEQLSMLLPLRPEWAFRLPSMVSFCCAVALVGFTGSRFGDPVTGGLAALLLAWNPLALDEIRIARCYGLVVLEAAVLMWITLAWCQRPRDIRLAIAFALTAGLLAWTHYLALLFACTCGAAMVFIPRRLLRPAVRFDRPSAALTTLVVAIVAVTCLPLVPALLRLNGWSPYMELQSVTPKLYDVAGPVWMLGFPVLLTGTLLSSLFQSRREESSTSQLTPLLWICGSIALGSLAIFMLFGIVGPHSLAANPRYQVAFTIALSLFQATVVRQRTAHLRHDTLNAVGVCLISIASTWIAFGQSPLVPTRLAAATGTASDWRRASGIISKQSRQHDLLLVQSGLVESYLVPELYADRLFMDYVACRVGKFYVPEERLRLALPCFWQGANDMTEFFRKEFKQVQANNASIWVAAATETDIMQRSLADTQSLLLKCGGRCTMSEAHPAMTLERYQFPGTQPESSTSSGTLNRNVPHE